MEMEEYTKEQIDGLRDLAENLTGKKFGNIKDHAKLQAIVDMAKAENAEAAAEQENNPVPLTLAGKAKLRNAARLEHTRLIRVNITAMAPFERQLQGNFFDVGNSVVGNIRYYVPFGIDWHVPVMLVNMLRDKKFRFKREYKDPQTRKTIYENRFAPAFGIVELENLTAEELEVHKKVLASREYGQH